MSTLYNLTTEYKKILDMALGMDEIDDETFEYIKSIDDAIEQKIENVTYVIKELSNNVEIINQEIDRLESRAHKYYKNLKSLKEYIISTMEISGKKKIETPKVTIGVRKSEVTEIDSDFIDEARGNNLYKLLRMIPARVEPDKQAIKEYIKQGNKLNHAKIIEKKNLSIR